MPAEGALSRHTAEGLAAISVTGSAPPVSAFSSSCSAIVVALESGDLDPAPTLAEFKAAQLAGPVCSSRLHALANGSVVDPRDDRGTFVAVGGVLYHQSHLSLALQLVAPTVFQHATVATRRCSTV